MKNKTKIIKKLTNDLKYLIEQVQLNECSQDEDLYSKIKEIEKQIEEIANS